MLSTFSLLELRNKEGRMMSSTCQGKNKTKNPPFHNHGKNTVNQQMSHPNKETPFNLSVTWTKRLVIINRSIVFTGV